MIIKNEVLQLFDGVFGRLCAVQLNETVTARLLILTLSHDLHGEYFGLHIFVPE